MKFEFTEGLKARVFNHFKGMDDKYVDLVRAYHRVYLNDNLSKEYKDQQHFITLDKVKALKQERVNAAKAEIEKIKGEYTEAPEAPKYTAEEKTYNLMLWTKIFPTATISELKALYEENKVDDDFIKLLTAEIRGRDEKDTPAATALLFTLENGVVDTRFKEIDYLAQAFNTWASMDFYVAGIEDNLSGVKYRDVPRDLAAFPIEDGPTFRPVFRLNIEK